MRVSVGHCLCIRPFTFATRTWIVPANARTTPIRNRIRPTNAEYAAISESPKTVSDNRKSSAPITRNITHNFRLTMSDFRRLCTRHACSELTSSGSWLGHTASSASCGRAAALGATGRFLPQSAIVAQTVRPAPLARQRDAQALFSALCSLRHPRFQMDSNARCRNNRSTKADRPPSHRMEIRS